MAVLATKGLTELHILHLTGHLKIGYIIVSNEMIAVFVCATRAIIHYLNVRTDQINNGLL